MNDLDDLHPYLIASFQGKEYILKKYYGWTLIDLLNKGNVEDFQNYCKYWFVDKESIRQKDNYVLRWLCTYGYVDLLKYIHTKFNLTTEDASSKNNYALRIALKNNHHNIVKYLRNYLL